MNGAMSAEIDRGGMLPKALQDRELGDGHHVGQDGPPRPELNRLGIGLLSEMGDPINRFRGHAGQLQFSGTPATGFLGRLGGQASSPISYCCNDMLRLDCRLEGALSVPKSCEKMAVFQQISSVCTLV